ncbi:hypothetical protein EGW08_009847, partial [Elysia chlorotica]
SCQGSFPSVTKLLRKSKSTSIPSFKHSAPSSFNFNILHCDVDFILNNLRYFSSCVCRSRATNSAMFRPSVKTCNDNLSRYDGDIHVLGKPSVGTPGLIAFQQNRRISGHSTKASPTRYYDVLGLGPNATQHQIKSAYYNMSKLYHPDVSKSAKSHTMFTEITEAYEVLGNLRKRRMYDRGIYTRNSPMQSDDTDVDYTEAYQQKAKSSPFERGNRPPPPRGRSNVYNFDEFYRQHYNEIRERRANEYKEFVQHQQNMKGKVSSGGEGLYYNRQNSQSLLVVLTALIVIATIAISLENYDKDLIGTNRAGVSHPNYYGVQGLSRRMPLASSQSEGKDQDSN